MSRVIVKKMLKETFQIVLINLYYSPLPKVLTYIGKIDQW